LEAARLLQLFDGHPILAGLTETVDVPPGEKIHLQGVIGSARAVFTSQLYGKLSRNILVILPEKPIFMMT
jgi:transcription-repair coupling factor (superfamily II helicase)